MVQVLLAKNTIYSDEVDMLMAKKSAKAVIQKIDERTEKTKKTKTQQSEKQKSTGNKLKDSIVKNEKTETEQPIETNKLEVLPSDKISENIEDALNQTTKKKNKSDYAL